MKPRRTGWNRQSLVAPRRLPGSFFAWCYVLHRISHSITFFRGETCHKRKSESLAAAGFIYARPLRIKEVKLKTPFGAPSDASFWARSKVAKSRFWPGTDADTASFPAS